MCHRFSHEPKGSIDLKLQQVCHLVVDTLQATVFLAKANSVMFLLSITNLKLQTQGGHYFQRFCPFVKLSIKGQEILFPTWIKVVTTCVEPSMFTGCVGTPSIIGYHDILHWTINTNNHRNKRKTKFEMRLFDTFDQLWLPKKPVDLLKL